MLKPMTRVFALVLLGSTTLAFGPSCASRGPSSPATKGTHQGQARESAGPSEPASAAEAPAMVAWLRLQVVTSDETRDPVVVAVPADGEVVTLGLPGVEGRSVPLRVRVAAVAEGYALGVAAGEEGAAAVDGARTLEMKAAAVPSGPEGLEFTIGDGLLIKAHFDAVLPPNRLPFEQKCGG